MARARIPLLVLCSNKLSMLKVWEYKAFLFGTLNAFIMTMKVNFRVIGGESYEVIMINQFRKIFNLNLNCLLGYLVL